MTETAVHEKALAVFSDPGCVSLPGAGTAVAGNATVRCHAIVAGYGAPSNTSDTEVDVERVTASEVENGSFAAGGGGCTVAGDLLGNSRATSMTEIPTTNPSAGVLTGTGLGHAFSNRSSAAVSQLEARWRGHMFPFVENAERTWEHAVNLLKASVGDGFQLLRIDKNRLKRRRGVASFVEDRVSIVHLRCAQSGKPQKSSRAGGPVLRRRKASKKIGCKFKVTMNWPLKAPGPRISEAGFCLRHCTPESGDDEHERPRVLGNELSAVEILGQEDLIRVLHESRAETADIHKALQVNGKRLGVLGKQMVRNIRQKIDRVTPETTPDAHTHSITNVRDSVYANSVAFGKELAGICGQINSVEGHARFLENLRNVAWQLVAVEVGSQSNASSSQVFKGAVSQGTEAGTSARCWKGSKGGGAKRGQGTESNGRRGEPGVM